MTCSGRVVLSEHNVPTFLTNILISPYPGAPSSHIRFRGLLPVHSTCRRPFQPVPQVGDLISFTGIILAIENDVLTITVDDFDVFSLTSIFLNVLPTKKDVDNMENLD